MPPCKQVVLILILDISARALRRRELLYSKIIVLCAVLLKACDDSVLFNPSQVEQWMKNFCFFSNIRNHAHSYAAKNEGP